MIAFDLYWYELGLLDILLLIYIPPNGCFNFLKYKDIEDLKQNLLVKTWRIPIHLFLIISINLISVIVTTLMSSGEEMDW